MSEGQTKIQRNFLEYRSKRQRDRKHDKKLHTKLIQGVQHSFYRNPKRDRMDRRK